MHVSKDPLFVTKHSGQKEKFSKRKLKNSLLKAGASTEHAESVIDSVLQDCYAEIKTNTIYRMAFKRLHQLSVKVATRYKLKQAIFDLGPTGYPFEILVAKILEKQGYQTLVGQMIPGKCVTHEVDVLAKKTQHQLVIECKFHNKQGIKCDVKVPLYFNSRYLDLKEGGWRNPGAESNLHGWLVTNTRFSADAINYGKCSRLKLIGWDYPKSGSLQDRISLSGLFPITILNSLSQKDCKNLISRGIILCSQLIEDEGQLQDVISGRKINQVIKEARQILNNYS